MTLLAVDFALLPDPAMAEQVMAINRGLVERFGSEIVLDASFCLPHLSLAMGCVDPKHLGVIGPKLQEIARENPPGPLTAIGLAVMTSATGRQTSRILIEKTGPLQRLHEEVMVRLSPFLSHDVTESMLGGSGPFSAGTLAWIRDFRSRSSFAFFWPHITLGHGAAAPLDRPISFVASALAMCHLGNHCTCREILTSVGWRG